MNKNFEKLKNLIVSQTNPFKVVVLTETWLADAKAHNVLFFTFTMHYSLFIIHFQYSSIHQIRKPSRKSSFYGVVLFIHKSLKYKVRHDLSRSKDIIETLPF